VSTATSRSQEEGRIPYLLLLPAVLMLLRAAFTNPVDCQGWLRMMRTFFVARSSAQSQGASCYHAL
jgi:hypothetical protein